jgi:hypothetical protein
MLSVSSIGSGRGGGYARYLEGKTVAPERGDYYLTPDGVLTEAPGQWLSDPGTLERLGVDPAGPVEGPDFIALMEGRHPGTGEWSSTLNGVAALPRPAHRADPAPGGCSSNPSLPGT